QFAKENGLMIEMIKSFSRPYSSSFLMNFAKAIYVCMCVNMYYDFDVKIRKNKIFCPADEIDDSIIINKFKEPVDNSVVLLASAVIRKKRKVKINTSLNTKKIFIEDSPENTHTIMQ